MRKLVRQVLDTKAGRFLLVAPFSFSLAIFLPTSFHRIFNLPEDISYILSTILILLINFYINRRYVFTANYPLKRQIFRYMSVSIFLKILEFLWYKLFLSTGGLIFELAIGAALVLSFVLKFFIFKYLVFSQNCKSLLNKNGK